MGVQVETLRQTAKEIRIDILKSLYEAGSGHPGGSLSATDLMTVLYFHEMKTDPANPTNKDRDKFVLSKGHAAPVLYVTLAKKGYFPQKELSTIRKMGSILQGHPDMRKVPGVEMSTGSLGQGVSSAVGMALAAKLDQSPSRIYTLLGDGELQEGLVWEALMSASHFKLDNLTVIIDWNGLQIDGKNEDVMRVTPIKEKLESFGFETTEIDGHDIEAIISALEQARKHKGGPFAIIAKTVKGKGVSFMENNHGWHGKTPNLDEAKQAVSELGGEW